MTDDLREPNRAVDYILAVVKWRSDQGLPALSATSHFIVKKERLMSDSNSTTKFCKKCQIETKRHASGDCKPCGAARAAAWYAANPVRAKASHAAWQSANPERFKELKAIYCAANKEKFNATTAAWRAANPERTNASIAAWKAANPERVKASAAARHAANPERRKAAEAAWRAENPEARRIHDQNRRARERKNGGVLSKGLSAKLFKLQDGKCPCCKQPLGDDFHLDHVIPLALGGPNTDDNMQLLRKTCNLQKSAKHPVQYMQERGFLL